MANVKNIKNLSNYLHIKLVKMKETGFLMNVLSYFVHTVQSGDNEHEKCVHCEGRENKREEHSATSSRYNWSL